MSEPERPPGSSPAIPAISKNREMIMSISTTLEGRDRAESAVPAALAAAVKRACAAYVARRMESAIGLLRAMSDEELAGIGLMRADLPGDASTGRSV
jgi:uncharacterized protein YjiS (DUF1127 family)